MPRTMTSTDPEFRFDGFDDPNTTPVPDLFFDEIMTNLKEAELRVMLYIFRRTFGFKRKADDISFNQFLHGITRKKDGSRQDHGCGIKNRTALSNALKSLEQMGFITSEKRKDKTGKNLTTVYKLRFKKDKPSQSQATMGDSGFDTEGRIVLQTYQGGSTPNVPPVVRQAYPQQTVKQQTENTSSIRKASPKNDERNEEEKGNQPPLEAPLTESAHKPPQLPQHRKPGKEGRGDETSSAGLEPEVSSQISPPGLTRQYLQQAQAQRNRQTNPQGLVSLSSLLPPSQQSLPKPTPKKRTYSQERQVLVDLLADLAREFRDEATLTESVSRAYNLMTKAQIKDIGVFTAKIYEARAITKERYGTIKRGRMPYFFSVLEDVCGQRIKPEARADAVH
jgi:Bacteriophage replication protein O